MMDTAAESTAPHRDEELLGELMRQLASAANVETVLENFCKRYPHLEAEARSYPRMQQVLQGVQPANVHPKQLGDFRIIRQMARGGMGVIYEAIQERLKRRVVLKTMKAGWDVGPARLRFRREQEVLAQLHQTHIVPIHTADEAEGLHYFVMPYIDGASLNHVVEEARNCETSQANGATTSLPAIAAAWLKKSSKYEARESEAPAEPPAMRLQEDPPSQGKSNKTMDRRELPMHYFRSVAQAMADVAEGLHYAHQEGLLHRDLKPSNVMIEPNGKCWIIDFGLAGFLHQREAIESSTPAPDETQSLTQGQTIGTPAYMAPEQWKDADNLDVRTDVWGLGTTLYELLTLQRAFKTSSKPDSATQRQQIRQLIEAESPRPVTDYVSNVPPDLVAICNKAMQKDPEKRYATAQAFADDLQHWLRREPTEALPGVHRAVWLWARRNTGWAAALLALVLGLIAIPSTFAIMQQQRSQELERESYVQQLMHIRSANHQVGWSENAKELARAGAKIGKTQKLTDEYAATLGFPDATMRKRFQGFGASGLAFDSEDKRLLIGGTETEHAKLWNSQTDEVIHSEQVGIGPVAFGPKGEPLQLILSPKNPHALWLWNIGKQELIREFKLPEKENLKVMAMAMVSDGSFVAAICEFSEGKGIVQVWETATGQLKLTLDQLATALAFSPDGQFFAVGSSQGVLLLSFPQGKLVAKLPSTHDVRILSLTFGRNPRPNSHPWQLAVGDAGGLITIWNLDKKIPLTYCRGSKYRIHSLTFSPDGVFLVSAGRSMAKLWDVATGQLLMDLANRSAMHASAYSLNGQFLAVSSIPMWGGTAETDKGGVDIWQLHTNRGIQTLRGLAGGIERVFFSSDGRLLAAISHHWQIGVWDIATGQLRYVLDSPEGYFVDNFALAFNQDASQLAFSTGKVACLFDANSGKQLQTWSLPPGLQDHIAFHPTGKPMLFRIEHEKGKDFKLEGQPLVCRVRELSGNQPVVRMEIRDFNYGVLGSNITGDGNYYIVNGLIADKKGRNGMTIAFDVNKCEELWRLPFSFPRTDGRTMIDMTGKLVACRIDSLMPPDLVEIGTGKILERMPEKDEWKSFPSQKYWVDTNIDSLLNRASSMPLINFATTFKLREVFWLFNSTQTQLAWGNLDGSVSVLDIQAVHRRLTEIGLGW